MLIIALFIAALLILGIALYLNSDHSEASPLQGEVGGMGWQEASPLQGEVGGGTEVGGGPEGSCCGQHAVCEKESLLSAMQKDIEYFADEELDRFRCTPADAYTEEEEEEFRTVLTTMREDEVPAWVRSLQLRGIEIPAGLRDEIIMIVGDLRTV